MRYKFLSEFISESKNWTQSKRGLELFQQASVIFKDRFHNGYAFNLNLCDANFRSA